MRQIGIKFYFTNFAIFIDNLTPDFSSVIILQYVIIQRKAEAQLLTWMTYRRRVIDRESTVRLLILIRE